MEEIEKQRTALAVGAMYDDVIPFLTALRRQGTAIASSARTHAPAHARTHAPAPNDGPSLTPSHINVYYVALTRYYNRCHYRWHSRCDERSHAVGTLQIISICKPVQMHTGPFAPERARGGTSWALRHSFRRTERHISATPAIAVSLRGRILTRLLLYTV